MSLIETVAALSLETLIMAGLMTTLGSAAAFTDQIRTQRDEVVDARRVEQLLDHAFARAGSGPSAPEPIALATPLRLVLQADLNGDAAIDSRSSERIELGLLRDGEHRRLVHRIGRQSVTVAAELPADARFDYRDADGNPTGNRPAIRLLRIPLGSSVYAVALRRGAS